MTTTINARVSRNQPLTTYVPVDKNIYNDGVSYRVRITMNGTKYSKNFSNKRSAVVYRNKVMRGEIL